MAGPIDPIEAFRARPVLPIDQAAELIDMPSFDIDQFRLPYTTRQAVKLLPADHPLRRQAEAALAKEAGLDLVPDPPRRPIRQRVGDWVAGRTPPRPDTRTRLEREILSRDTLNSDIQAQRNVVARLQDDLDRAADVTGLTASERQALLARRQAHLDSAQAQLDDMLETRATPGRTAAIADDIRSGAQLEVERVRARMDTDPDLRRIYGDEVRRVRAANLRSQRIRARMRGAGFTLLGILATGLGAGVGMWINRRTQEDVDAAALAHRAVRGELTDDDMDVIVDEFGEEGAAELLNEADRAREEGVDLGEVRDEVEREIGEPDADGNPPAVEQAPDLAPQDIPPQGAGLERPPSVFNPPSGQDPFPRPVPVSLDIPPEEAAAPQVGGDTDDLVYEGQNPHVFLSQNRDALVAALIEQGLSTEDITRLHDDLTRQYFREGLADVAPTIGERYVSGENLFGDNPALGLADDALGAISMPAEDMVRGFFPDLLPEEIDPASPLGYIFNNPMARAADFIRGVMIPSSTDTIPRRAIGLAENWFTNGSQVPRLVETLDPLFREGRNALGLDPMGPDATADLPSDDLRLDVLDRAATEPANDPGSTPNAFSAPRTYQDLLQMENMDMLPFAGGALENAQALGIEIPPRVRDRFGLPDPPPRVMEDPPSLRGGQDTDDQAGLDGTGDTPPAQEVVDELLRQDEVINPRGQQPNDPFVPAPFDDAEPEIMAQPSAPSGIGAALGINAANASALNPVTQIAPEEPPPQVDFAPPVLAEAGIPSPPSVDTGTPDYAAPTGDRRPTPTPSRERAASGGDRPGGAVGDFRGSQTGDPASLADDAEEAERELNAINRWLEDRGFDEDERNALSLGLIRMGATMMSTPGSFGEALGAGLNAGLDQYTGEMSEAEAEALARAELAGQEQERALRMSLAQSREARERLRFEREGVAELERELGPLEEIMSNAVLMEEAVDRVIAPGGPLEGASRDEGRAYISRMSDRFRNFNSANDAVQQMIEAAAIAAGGGS